MIETYSKYELNKEEKVILAVIAAAGSFITGELFYGTWMVIMITPLVWYLALKPASSFLAKRRRDELRTEFRDLLNMLSSSFATGLHMRDALKEAESGMLGLYGSESVLLKEIIAINGKINDGETDIKALRDFSERAGIEDIELFTDVYGTCRETGGDLISVMSETASMLGDKIRIEGDIRSMTKERKTEGVIITLMPVVILLLLRIVSPGYVGMLYGNLMGVLIMTIAVLGIIYAYYMIVKITEIRV